MSQKSETDLQMEQNFAMLIIKKNAEKKKEKKKFLKLI